MATYADKFEKCFLKITCNNPEKERKLLDPYIKGSRFPRTQILEYANDPRIGENVGLIDCLAKIKNEYNGDVDIFFASTNGVSKKDETVKKNIRAWVRAMTHLGLHNFDLVDEVFDSGYHCLGSFKRDVMMEKGGPYPCPWHYSGLFYWIRGKELFKRNWKFLADCRHGIEMYPGYLFTTQESYCLFNTQQDMYHEELKDEQWLEKLRLSV